MIGLEQSQTALIVFAVMEASETQRGPAPSLPLHDLVLERPQNPLTNQGLLSTLKSTMLLSSHRGPSA
jgi:hypothetical protein